MRKSIFLLIAVSIYFACTSNVKEERQENVDNYEKVENSIYLDDFEPSGFTYADFIDLKRIVNKDYDRLDTVPKDIAYRLTSLDTSEVILFCRWVDSTKGVFRLVTDLYSKDIFVSFSENGKPLDYIVIRGAKREVTNGKKVYNKFYSYFYFSDNYIVVETLDTTEKIAHPDLAKVLKTDTWYIDENGKFELRKE